MIGRSTGVAALLFFALTTATVAQSGVPGGRLDTGRDHRAAVRAEAYTSVARFFAEWREAWNNGDAEALTRLYTEDAALRLPGQNIVRGKEPVETAVRAAAAGAVRIETADIDFDSDGERSVLVARYTLRREGHLVEGIMTAMMYRHRSSWRLRVQVFDAPEKAATTPSGAPPSDPPLSPVSREPTSR